MTDIVLWVCIVLNVVFVGWNLVTAIRYTKKIRELNREPIEIEITCLKDDKIIVKGPYVTNEDYTIFLNSLVVPLRYWLSKTLEKEKTQ